MRGEKAGSGGRKGRTVEGGKVASGSVTAADGFSPEVGVGKDRFYPGRCVPSPCRGTAAMGGKRTSARGVGVLYQGKGRLTYGQAMVDGVAYRG